MRPSIIGLFGFLFIQTTPIAGQETRIRDTVLVFIPTELGNIEVELYSKKAPITVKNFLKYVDADFYDGGLFHRTVKLNNQPGKKVLIEVIQASIYPDSVGRKEIFPPIPLERTNKTGLRHWNGTISMARDTPDSATSDFFICIGDQPSLDYRGKRNPDGQGFAAFGKVVRGMDVVKKIQMSRAEGQTLTPPVRIMKIVRR
jgi:peptidyl-prolyl cis-trans isomerase A (cyclophilin A)